MRRTRLGRLRLAVDAATAVVAAPPKEVWLPVKDGSGHVPSRYPDASGRVVLVLYDPDDPAATEAPA